MRSLRLEDEAEQDVQAAFNWYQDQRRGLGHDFLLSVEAALAKVVRHPETFAIAAVGVRRAPLRRFPYGIYYSVEGDEIIVRAVMHAKRNPRLWRKRRPR